MPRAGMLLQADGSRHDWLEGRGPYLTLIAGIDDATGVGHGRDLPRPRGRGRATSRCCARRSPGTVSRLPCTRTCHGIFVKDPDRGQTLAEQLAGQPSRTQVGRALEAAGIRWIGARSPQAKGRSERLWGTFQDRLVSELRREGVATIEDANALLARHLPRHNRRFAVPAADAEPRPGGHGPTGPPPEAVFCFEYTRRVERDATIGWDGACR